MRTSTRRFVAPLMVALIVVAAGLPGAPSPVRAAGPVTALVIDSEAGDAIGQGQQLEYEPPAASFNIATFDPGWTFVQVLGAQGGDFWNVTLRAAGAGTLAVGTYEDAQRIADATHPGLDISGQGRGCNMSTGRFVIGELERDMAGNVSSIAASFEQHCEGGPAALFGEIRYQASAGYKLLTVAPASIDLGSAGIGLATPTQTVHLTASGTAGVSLSALSIGGANAADFSIVSETCPVGALAVSTSCDIAVRAVPKATGARAAALVIGNDTFRGQRTIPLTAAGVTPVSAVAWGTTITGPNFGWNNGQSLARTATTGATYLHATYTTDRVSGAWVDDNGPYAGINYVRSSDQGSTFTTPKRLNPSTQHGSRGSLAASGSYVYATWVSTSRWIAFQPTAPRVLYLRRGSNHGSSTGWGTIKRLTSLTGRVDFPTVAAAGANVYVAYTDSGSGSVRVRISRDRAATWTTTSLGTTGWSTTSGKIGIPSIAASGNTVVVSWVWNASGAVKARVSTDAGVTWGPAAGLSASSTDMPAVAALGTRAAVAWTNGSAAIVRTWSAGTWSTPRSTGTPTGATYTHSYGPAVALSGASGVSVAWSGCVTSCETWTSSTRANLIWSESRDSGATWFAGQVIGSSGASTARRYNDYPSILWPSATVRHVLWNAGTAGTTSYRLLLRTGTGVVAASAATATDPAVSQYVEAGDRDRPTTRSRAPGGP